MLTQLHLGVTCGLWMQSQGSVPAPAVADVAQMIHAVIGLLAAFDEQLMQARSWGNTKVPPVSCYGKLLRISAH